MTTIQLLFNPSLWLQINSLDAREGVKIRYKIVLALTHIRPDLYNPRSFDDLPLEMMPYLLEMIQLWIGYNGFGKDIAPNGMPDPSRVRSGTFNWENLTWDRVSKDAEVLNRVYELILSSPILPLLVVRGPGELKSKGNSDGASKKKSKTKPRKRRKFGDIEDFDDEAWIPKGARTKAKWVYNSETNRWERIPPPIY